MPVLHCTPDTITHTWWVLLVPHYTLDTTTHTQWVLLVPHYPSHMLGADVVCDMYPPTIHFGCQNYPSMDQLM